LFIERVTYSQGEIPVEFLRVYYRADRYSLYNELRE
jgi:DNA-binding GntR family transcriptional regulator